MRAIIIGGGIGGLTAAIALRRAGIDPEVYERAPGPREIGAGISLWANALAALKHVGALGPVLARGEVMRRAEIRTHRGRVLKSSDASGLDTGAGVPAILMIHRAELLGALLDQLPPGVVRFGHECRSVGQDQFGVRTLLRNSRGDTHIQADLLIGADGIHSAVRAGLFGPQRPRYSGYTCWRGVAAVPESLVPPGYLAEVWGRGQRFGITRIGQGRVYWWASVNAPEGGTDTDARAELARTFGNWATPVPAIIDATLADAIIRNDIVDRPPSRIWGVGRVTLLGDAAHPTTPNLGMGGCMAIEDGAVLAEHLQRPGPTGAALRAYERARYDRTAMITRTSCRFGASGQWTSPIACWARNTATWLLPARFVTGQQRKLMEFKV